MPVPVECKKAEMVPRRSHQSQVSSVVGLELDVFPSQRPAVAETRQKRYNLQETASGCLRFEPGADSDLQITGTPCILLEGKVSYRNCVTRWS